MPKAKDKTSTVDSSPLEAGVAGAQRLSGSRNVVPTIDSARRPGDEFTGAAEILSHVLRAIMPRCRELGKNVDVKTTVQTHDL